MDWLHLLRRNLVDTFFELKIWYCASYSLVLYLIKWWFSYLFYAQGGKHHRFKRGYKNVIDEAIRLVSLLFLHDSDCPVTCPMIPSSMKCKLWVFQNSTGEESHLAMETSGHGALKENHWLDDGAYMMVRVFILLHSLKLYEPCNYMGTRWKCWHFMLNIGWFEKISLNLYGMLAEFLIATTSEALLFVSLCSYDSSSLLD